MRNPPNDPMGGRTVPGRATVRHPGRRSGLYLSTMTLKLPVTPRREMPTRPLPR